MDALKTFRLTARRERSRGARVFTYFVRSTSNQHGGVNYERERVGKFRRAPSYWRSGLDAGCPVGETNFARALVHPRKERRRGVIGRHGSFQIENSGKRNFGHRQHNPVYYTCTALSNSTHETYSYQTSEYIGTSARQVPAMR